MPLDGIPDTVTHLKLLESQETLIPHWPPQLQVLDVGGAYDDPRLNELPSTVTELYIKLDRYRPDRVLITALPEKLRVLELRSIICHENLQLPQTLKVLTLDMMSKECIRPLPLSLREFKLAGYGYRKFDCALPQALEVLDLGLCYSF
jgi:hypothetical protein